jgi:hypothetical protein
MHCREYSTICIMYIHTFYTHWVYSTVTAIQSHGTYAQTSLLFFTNPFCIYIEL